jgi:hypothetical protein
MPSNSRLKGRSSVNVARWTIFTARSTPVAKLRAVTQEIAVRPGATFECKLALERISTFTEAVEVVLMDAPGFKAEKVRIDVLRRFGYYSTESNGHLSEYLPWYRKRTNEIEKWIDLSSWINGETGGYLRVCTEGRNWFETDFPNWMQQPAYQFVPEKRSGERGSYIIEALALTRSMSSNCSLERWMCASARS